MAVVVGIAVVVVGEVMTGIVGIVGTTRSDVGATLGVGIAAAELTPRLPISVESRGMPGRPRPPGAAGVIGVDDVAILDEPEPHIPDMPDVSIMVEVGDADIDIVLAVVAGAVAPRVVPPPSNVAVDPNIAEGDVPMVAHPEVPTAPVDVGAGLTPGEAISVAPSGIPVPPTGVLGSIPRGEVADTEGVGVTAICAKAGPVSSGEMTATIRRRFMTDSSNAIGSERCAICRG
ncbi:hypothetical protein [Bradyrhizobium sp. ARR65]|uniref:hypothetical protein n=1 Tax=Bradyrhizobium sp. ARR65 TaxID=1040989 RepID=UPI000466FEA6|nr:hypothetical protein [Bradyrhizobium sp. ARR65]